MGKIGFFALFAFLDYLFLQKVEISRTQNYIDVRIFFLKNFVVTFLLGHTADDGHDKVFVFLLYGFDCADIAESAFLGGVPDATGVKNDYIRFFDAARGSVPQLFQNARNLLRFVHVHLAAVTDVCVFHICLRQYYT